MKSFPPLQQATPKELKLYRTPFRNLIVQNMVRCGRRLWVDLEIEGVA
jgi:hypothetical protein